MIFIVVKFLVKPEHADMWPEIVRDYTQATRAEPGNLWFDWSRSVENPNEYVLIEAFRDDGAEPHVKSEHFQQAINGLPQYLQETPRIRNVQLEGDDWNRMGEMTID